MLLLLLWILIFIFLIELILYQPLIPVDLRGFDTDTGTIIQAGSFSLTIPRNTKKLEIVVYNSGGTKVSLCNLNQGTTQLGKHGFVSKNGFSRFVVDLRRSFNARTQCTLLFTDVNTGAALNINLKTVKAWIT